MNYDKQLLDFLASYGDLEKEVKEESIEAKIRDNMSISKYNEMLQQRAKREIKFDIPEEIVVDKKNKVKMKNTGWVFYDIDIKAIEDFIYNRSCDDHACGMQEVLKYALRYYIPKEIYDDILSRQENSKENVEDITTQRLRELQNNFGNLENYHKSIRYKSAYKNGQFNCLTSKPSWKIPFIDYMAVMDFKKIFDITYQDTCMNAIRFYLSQLNYRHAEKIIEVLQNNKEENIAQYRGEINDLLK